MTLQIVAGLWRQFPAVAVILPAAAVILAAQPRVSAGAVWGIGSRSSGGPQGGAGSPPAGLPTNPADLPKSRTSPSRTGITAKGLAVPLGVGDKFTINNKDYAITDFHY